MRRKLGTVEHAFTLNGRADPLVAVSVLRLTRALEPDKLGPALQTLQQCHPLLRAVLIAVKNDFYFEISPAAPPIPIVVQPRLDDNHWQRVAAAELNQEIGNDGSVMVRVTYLFSAISAPAELIVSFHHSIIDATSGTYLLEQLLRLCSGQEAADQLGHELLPPAEKRLPAPYQGLTALPKIAGFMLGQMADEIGYRIGTRGKRTQPIYPTAKCAILSRTLEAGPTTQLIQQSRRRRITLNCLMSAALLKAVHELLYDEAPMPLRAIMFGNLRPYLDPPLPPDDLGCMITMLRHTLPLEQDLDIWQVARRVQEKNQQSLKRGEKFLALILTKQIIQMTLRMKSFRLATTALSYAGPLNLQKHYGSIEVGGLHNFVSNNRLGPEYVSTAHLFSGQLVWDFLYLDSDMDRQTAEKIANRAITLLEEAAVGRSSG